VALSQLPNSEQVISRRLWLLLWIFAFTAGCLSTPLSTPTPIAKTTIPATPAEVTRDTVFLAQYGWTVTQPLAVYQVTLPASFEHSPGDFPLPIYWAYNNEFSKAIGLSLEPYLGKEVTATLYALKEELPTFLRPYTQARAVIITDHEEIIGAWIDTLGMVSFACSLERKPFNKIVQQRWGEWLLSAGVVNSSNALEQKLAQMTPEELITTYYQAIDEQDFHLAYATLSRQQAVEYLFTNMRENDLFNQSYAEAFDGWPETIQMAKLESLKPIRPGSHEFEVWVDMKFSKAPPALPGDGKYLWFVIVTEEIEGLGWRIQSIGTGP